MMDLVYVSFGLVLLVFGGDWLLKAAVDFSLKLNIPKIVVGLTVVSLATSMPELIVSINSALKGSSDLAIGNVIGSNIANIGLVLSITTILTAIGVDKKFITADWIPLIASSLLLFVLIYYDGFLSRFDGILMVLFLIAFIISLILFRKGEDLDDEVEGGNSPVWKLLGFLLIGGVGLWLGSELLIKGAVSLASKLGVSEAIIGLTVVSVGTSIPELVASILAVVRGQKSIGLGNIIGSNMFNILCVLGITAIIKPIPVAANFIDQEIYWMLLFTTVLLPLILLPKKNVFSKFKGLFLLVLYAYYIYRLIL